MTSNGDGAAVRARSARSFVTVASIAATSLAVPPEIQPSANRAARSSARSESPPRRIGGCGSVAGRGAKCTASKSKWRPWYDGVVSVHSARSTSMHSSVREKRRFGSSPSAVNSSVSQPAPTPSTTRPPDSTSSDVTARAVTNGCRSGST